MPAKHVFTSTMLIQAHLIEVSRAEAGIVFRYKQWSGDSEKYPWLGDGTVLLHRDTSLPVTPPHFVTPLPYDTRSIEELCVKHRIALSAVRIGETGEDVSQSSVQTWQEFVADNKKNRGCDECRRICVTTRVPLHKRDVQRQAAARQKRSAQKELSDHQAQCRAYQEDVHRHFAFIATSTSAAAAVVGLSAQSSQSAASTHVPAISQPQLLISPSAATSSIPFLTLENPNKWQSHVVADGTTQRPVKRKVLDRGDKLFLHHYVAALSDVATSQLQYVSVGQVTKTFTSFRSLSALPQFEVQWMVESDGVFSAPLRGAMVTVHTTDMPDISLLHWKFPLSSSGKIPAKDINVIKSDKRWKELVEKKGVSGFPTLKHQDRAQTGTKPGDSDDDGSGESGGSDADSCSRSQSLRPGEFLVESLLMKSKSAQRNPKSSRSQDYEHKYLVKWKGYDETSWEFESDIGDDALKAFAEGTDIQQGDPTGSDSDEPLAARRHRSGSSMSSGQHNGTEDLVCEGNDSDEALAHRARAVNGKAEVGGEDAPVTHRTRAQTLKSKSQTACASSVTKKPRRRRR